MKPANTKYTDPNLTIRAMRIALGKSQVWLANKLHVQTSAVSYYERREDNSALYFKVDPDKARKVLFDELERQVKENGKWYRDILNLKIAISIIDELKYNPKEQKKAHKELLMPLFSEKKITPWIYIVKDPAFGDMELFKDGDNSE
jgi:DNA-binding XRE family transcriptional regulator